MTPNGTVISTDKEPVETFYSLEEARFLFPNGKVSRTSIERWRKYGVNGVRLQTYLLGARRYTTLAAIRAFVEAQQSCSEND